MYCCIRNYNDFCFNGDKSHIKEFIFDLNSNVEKLLLETKDKENVVIKMPDHPTEDDIELAFMLKAARDNIRFMVSYELIEGLPCFYQPGFYDADSLDKLRALCERGVTDVYISGQLGFSLFDVRTIVEKFNVKVRVVPNVAQVADFGIGCTQKDGNITAFWIRPEDLELYKELIDVVEFICSDEKQNIFYEIYFQDKSWSGNLGTIIAGLEEVPNKGLPSNFTLRRIDCGKKCLLDLCHSCYKYKYLAFLVKDNNLNIEETESE